MEKYMALGSVVLLEGGTQKLLLIARALHVKNGAKTFFFDYGAVPYPQGLIGDQMIYFNSKDISKVIFEGYSEVEDENLVEGINRYLETHPDIVRGSAEAWNSAATK